MTDLPHKLEYGLKYFDTISKWEVDMCPAFAIDIHTKTLL